MKHDDDVYDDEDDAYDVGSHLTRVGAKGAAKARKSLCQASALLENVKTIMTVDDEPELKIKL